MADPGTCVLSMIESNIVQSVDYLKRGPMCPFYPINHPEGFGMHDHSSGFGKIVHSSRNARVDDYTTSA